MRRFAFKAAALALVLVIFAPAALSASENIGRRWTPADVGDVTVDVMWWGGDARHEAMLAALDIFMERYPNVTIEPIFVSFADYYYILLVHVAAGMAPDLMQIHYPWVQFYVSNGVLLDLNTVAHILDLNEWEDWQLDFKRFEGELAAVPHGITGRVVLYNRPLLEEFGLQTFPATTQGLLRLGQQLELDDYYFALVNADGLLFDFLILTWLYATTGNAMQEGGQMLHAVHEVAAVFDLVGRMQRAGAVQSPWQEDFVSWSADPIWTQGFAAGVLTWTDQVHLFIDSFQTEGGGNWDDLGITALPVPAGASPVIKQRPSMGHAIARDSRHPEVVAYLLNFLYTDEVALTALGSTLGLPVSRTARDVAMANDLFTPSQIEAMDFVTASGGAIDARFEDPALRQLRLEIIEDFRNGRINSREAARRFIDQQQAVLDTFYN